MGGQRGFLQGDRRGDGEHRRSQTNSLEPEGVVKLPGLDLYDRLRDKGGGGGWKRAREEYDERGNGSNLGQMVKEDLHSLMLNDGS